MTPTKSLMTSAASLGTPSTASAPITPPSARAHRASTESSAKTARRRRRRRSSRRGKRRARGAQVSSIRAEVSGAVVQAPRECTRLGDYTDAGDRAREVIAVPRRDGCMLVVDRDAITLGDRRLVACLYADEPAGNATVVFEHYMNDPNRGRCRQVSVEDLIGVACAEGEPGAGSAPEDPHAELVNHGDHDWAYRLEAVCTNGLDAHLRWCRYARRDREAPSTPVCLREVVGALESYEPVYELTRRGIALHEDDPVISTKMLCAELERIRRSPIVLNRKLRQAVLAAGELHGLSMSEIAWRCGRVKRDGKGNSSGETSWLARRLGIVPESGTDRPTPWVHSDVLAVIARNGLGISPREVELG